MIVGQHVSFGRRRFLQGTGFLALSFAIPRVAQGQAAQELPGDLRRNPWLSSWIRVNADQTVTIMIGKVELGQGVLTAMAQIAADELDVAFNRIKVLAGDTFVTPNEGTTAGSQSMANCGPAVHQASAEVRAILLNMAANTLGQPAKGLRVADGTIIGSGGAKTSYWELVVGKALEVQATGRAKPKPISEHKVIGKSLTRIDIPPKMMGERIFIQEMQLPQMVHGRVVRPPTYKASLKEVDTKGVEAMPGVVKVVRDGSFLGVVALREEEAVAAASALSREAKWNVEAALPGSDAIYDWLQRAPAQDIHIKNEPLKPGITAARVIEATYYRPYQMHASIGTSAAIGMLSADGIMTIHTHSQSVFETAKAIAGMLGMNEKKVRAIHAQGAGCYGHNLADDAAADAALLARAVPGRPVKLQYSRDQEHKWEPYGSAMVIKTKAGVDANGNVLDWNLELWSTPHGTRPGGDPGNLLSARYLEKPFPQPVPNNGGPPNYAADRNAIALYSFPGHKVTTHFITEMPLRVSSTRALGAYANVFAIESFIDELAGAAKADPVEYRLRFLKDERGRAVLSKAAEAFGWRKWRRREGRGRGVAFAQYKNTSAYTAVALEVDVNRSNGRVRVLRAVAANDSGHMVSPDGVTNQIEGGLIQSLSWSLKEEVKFDRTRILSEDWASYPILTFQEVPPVQVVLIDAPGKPYLGTGEAAQGPTAGALANAIFDATGVRFRQLPFTPDRIKEKLVNVRPDRSRVVPSR